MIANVGNAKFDGDALPFGQAKGKFLAKDGDTIDAGDKKIVHGLEATDDYDFVVKKQLDDVQNELEDLIDDIGGGGTSILDIVSLLCSLTSLGTSLAALGIKAGTSLTAIASTGSSLLNGVLALGSVVKDGAQVLTSASVKLASGTSLDDYVPDPARWDESAADLARLRDGANNVA